ncbi:MAG TPA: DUF6504 family protein [Streptosporangiaceae bacterium]|nr:DUF6504 family protein [Streptosporangiaceae bacterium]
MRSDRYEYIFELEELPVFPWVAQGATRRAAPRWPGQSRMKRGTSPERGDEAMNAGRAEPVQVQLQDGRPTRFVWRERLYTVLAIVERPGEAAAAAAASEWAQDQDSHDHEPAARRDWQCWRVSASPGKNVPATGFRLCHDAATDRWILTRDSSSG